MSDRLSPGARRRAVVRYAEWDPTALGEIPTFDRVALVEVRSDWGGGVLFDFAEQTAIPISTDAVLQIDDGAFEARVSLGLQNDENIGFSRVEISALKNAASRDDIRGLPWGDMLDAVVSVAGQRAVFAPGEDGGLPRVVTLGSDEWASDPSASIRAGRAARGRPPGYTSAQLQEAADLYREAKASEAHRRSPQQYVATKLDLSLATAGRRIKAAREAGLLESDGRP